MTPGENVAAGAQILVAAQQRTQAEPELKRGKWVFVVTLRVSFGGWLVARKVSEVMQVSVLQYWTTCPALDQKQVPVPLEWFLVS